MVKKVALKGSELKTKLEVRVRYGAKSYSQWVEVAPMESQLPEFRDLLNNTQSIFTNYIVDNITISLPNSKMKVQFRPKRSL